MKTYLLPYYCKWISLAILCSSGLFLYMHNITAVELTITVGGLGWLFSAERNEDERTAQQRLVAVRAGSLSAILFGILSMFSVGGGYTSSPTIFCVIPVSLIMYLAAFYWGLFMPNGHESEE